GLAERLGVEASEVEAVLAGVKRRVALDRVRAILDGRPEANLSAREVFAQISRRPFEEQTADRADVLFAYLRAAGLRELRDKCPPVPDALKGRLPHVEGEVIPPLGRLTRGTRKDG